MNDLILLLISDFRSIGFVSDSRSVRSSKVEIRKLVCKRSTQQVNELFLSYDESHFLTWCIAKSQVISFKNVFRLKGTFTIKA